MKSTHIKAITWLLSIISITISTGTAFALTYPPLPSDINGYLDTSDLIVIGRIGRLHQAHQFYGYGTGARAREELDAHTPITLSLPMADYYIDVEEIIKDDEQFPISERATSPILRVIQRHDALFHASTARQNSGRFALFLRRNPDDQTYGFHSFMHRVKLTNEKGATFFFQGEDYTVFDTPMSTDEVLREVRQTNANRHLSR